MFGKKKRKYKSGRAYKLDRARRSKEPWERGRGAPRKGNPSYMPKEIIDKNGHKRKVYVVRER